MWSFELTLTRWRSLVERPLNQSNEGQSKAANEKNSI